MPWDNTLIVVRLFPNNAMLKNANLFVVLKFR